MTCRPYCNGQYDMHPKALAVLRAHGRDRPAACTGRHVNGETRKRHLWRRVPHTHGLLYSTRHTGRLEGIERCEACGERRSKHLRAIEIDGIRQHYRYMRKYWDHIEWSGMVDALERAHWSEPKGLP